VQLITSVLRLVHVPVGLSGVEYCGEHEGLEFPTTPSPSPPSWLSDCFLLSCTQVVGSRVTRLILKQMSNNQWVIKAAKLIH
jgi:hypothetical protein